MSGYLRVRVVPLEIVTPAFFQAHHLNDIFRTWGGLGNGQLKSSSHEPVAMEDIWGSFFRQSEEVLLMLLASGRVTVDDVDDIEEQYSYQILE